MSCILRGLGKQTIHLKGLSAGKTCVFLHLSYKLCVCGHLLIRFRSQKMLWMVLICLSKKSAVTSAVINYWKLERAPYRTRALAVVLLCCVMAQTDVLYPAVSSCELQQTPTHTPRSKIHSWKQTCRRRDRSTVYFCLDFNPQETKVTLNCVP